MKYWAASIISIFLLACQSSSNSNKKASDQSENVAVETKLSSIPESTINELFNECDLVDYIFYELPFSMSYDQKSTIQSALSWVSKNADIPTSGCKALGRMIFQKQGEIMVEAEIFVSDQCAHYTWIKEGKRIHANQMTTTGKQHYMGIIQQFNK